MSVVLGETLAVELLICCLGPRNLQPSNQITMIRVPFFHGGLIFPVFLGTAILDRVRFHDNGTRPYVIQDGSTWESQQDGNPSLGSHENCACSYTIQDGSAHLPGSCRCCHLGSFEGSCASLLKSLVTQDGDVWESWEEEAIRDILQQPCDLVILYMRNLCWSTGKFGLCR